MLELKAIRARTDLSYNEAKEYLTQQGYKLVGIGYEDLIEKLEMSSTTISEWVREAEVNYPRVLKVI